MEPRYEEVLREALWAAGWSEARITGLKHKPGYELLASDIWQIAKEEECGDLAAARLLIRRVNAAREGNMESYMACLISGEVRRLNATITDLRKRIGELEDMLLHDDGIMEEMTKEVRWKVRLNNAQADTLERIHKMISSLLGLHSSFDDRLQEILDEFKVKIPEPTKTEDLEEVF